MNVFTSDSGRRLPVFFTLTRLLALGLAFGTVSCKLLGGSDSGGTAATYPGGSCLAYGANNCQDYAAIPDPQLDQSICAQSISIPPISGPFGMIPGSTIPGGTYSQSPCPTTNLVGTCSYSGGGDTQFYNTGSNPYNLQLAEQSCSQASGTFMPASAYTGPIDGTWTVTNITCNGVAGNSNVQSGYTNGTTESFTLEDTIGSYNTTTNGCTWTIPATYSYSGSDVTVSISGTIACSPANCSTYCGDSSSTGPFEYSYAKSGSTLTWTSIGTGDTTCSGASPAQGNPIEYTFSGP